VPSIDPQLVEQVSLLCLDAGNTVVFLDHARLAALCAREGLATTAEALARAEGEMKHALERGALVEVTWKKAGVESARGWGMIVGTMLRLAGASLDRLPAMLDALWADHCAHNLWSLVPQGLSEAVARVRRCGVRVAVVSNSEGMLERQLAELGLRGCFDRVVDSGVVGIEKPEPRIFQLALDELAVSPARALHLGDNYATDVLGARAAGIRVALVDPLGHLNGRHPDVPRVPGAPEVANAIALWYEEGR
jgi:putative hydrolase of the HAD superfamily